MAITNGLLGLYMAEEVNLAESSVLTPSEMDTVLDEASSLDPSDPTREQFVRRVNRGAKNKQTVVPTDDLTIRAEWSIRAHMIPRDDIRQAIALGRLKIVNNAFYRILHFTGKQGDLMFNADAKESGVTNVNSRKLEENNFFLLTSIILQTGTFTAGAAAHTASNFGVPCREVLNGEFSLKNGDKVIVPPTSARIFDNSSNNNAIRGEWKLDNPKFIAPLVEIIPELKLPLDMPANTAVKIVLVGAGLCKA